MSTKKWSFLHGLLNFGDEEVARTQILISNFITAFSEYSHNRHFNIFYCKSDGINTVTVHRLSYLDDYPIPLKNFRPKEYNSFSFYLEQYEKIGYRALILGDTLLTPINQAMLKHGGSLFKSEFQWNLSTYDAPSISELKLAFAEASQEGEKALDIRLGEDRSAFADYLNTEVLPVWLSMQARPTWKSALAQQGYKLRVDL